MFFGATTFGNRTFGNQSPKSVNVTPTGIGVTATEGALIFIGDVTTFPTGIGITSTQASVVLPNVDVSLTGIQINSTFNNSGVAAEAETTVFPAGVIVNMVQNSVGVRGWDAVDDSVTNTWTPVSDTASFSWAAVDDSATNTWTEVDDRET
tara:strand:+ start:431 stop:883 length:453 start_codon:yes stop_codon:yes gene_type:complete